jgi:hypothetical protein
MFAAQTPCALTGDADTINANVDALNRFIIWHLFLYSPFLD